MNLKRRLKKNNAFSLFCYDAITPQVWEVFNKWKNHIDIDAKIYRYIARGREVFQIEFIGKLILMEEDILRVNPNFIRRRRALLSKLFTFWR